MFYKKIRAFHAYLFVSPALLVILLIVLYPLFHTLRISFYQSLPHLPFLPEAFIGLGNYRKLLSDSRFLMVLKNTLYFVGVSIPLELLLGLIIALVINKEFKGRGIIRAAVLVPWALMTVVSAQMWRWIFHDRVGAFNYLIYGSQVQHYYPWLVSTNTAMKAIILAEVWKTTPFAALMLLAGLQIIPQELYEAAEVDGAGALRKFRYVTLPLLKPAILLALLFRTMDAFRVFDIVFVMTGGGPGVATETLSVYAQKVLFRAMDMGYGSALAVVNFLCIAVISIAYIKLLGYRIELWK